MFDSNHLSLKGDRIYSQILTRSMILDTFSESQIQLHNIASTCSTICSGKTADPGVANLILTQSHTFSEIDLEIISTVILLLPLIQEGLSVTSKGTSMKYPGVASSIPARYHTLVEIDHDIISRAILLPSAESFKKGCCQLQAKVCARSTG